MSDPSALMRLGETTDDPTAMWTKLETCASPAGDACDRAAAALAITVGDLAATNAEYAARCRALPAADQKCLTRSYSTSHPECDKVQEAFRRAQPPK